MVVSKVCQAEAIARIKSNGAPGILWMRNSGLENIVSSPLFLYY